MCFQVSLVRIGLQGHPWAYRRLGTSQVYCCLGAFFLLIFVLRMFFLQTLEWLAPSFHIVLCLYLIFDLLNLLHHSPCSCIFFMVLIDWYIRLFSYSNIHLLGCKLHKCRSFDLLTGASLCLAQRRCLLRKEYKDGWMIFQQPYESCACMRYCPFYDGGNSALGMFSSLSMLYS